MNETGIRWMTKSVNVDVDTGEQISEAERKQQYIIIKKDKNVWTNKNKTLGNIEFTNQCRRKPQLEIW